MRLFIDERGGLRDGDLAPIAAELQVAQPDFDVPGWVIKVRGWVEVTMSPDRCHVRWRPTRITPRAARTAREILLQRGPLARIELERWTDRWRLETADAVSAAWTLTEAGHVAKTLPPAWRVVRRNVSDLYRDRHMTMIEDMARVVGRGIDRTTAAEIVATTPSGLVAMVERKGRNRPFHYIRIGDRTPFYDNHEAYIGRDLRESSDPAFSASVVPIFEEAAATDVPVVEDVEGAVQFADGRLHQVCYRRLLWRVAASPDGAATIMKTAAWLRRAVPVAA
jgi:hypothetical protein